MTDAERRVLEGINDIAAQADDTIGHISAHFARTLKAMLADRESIWPVLPKEPNIEMRRAMWNGFEPLQRMDDAYRALYAHLTKPQVDFDALDEARMEPRIEAAVERAFFKSVEIVAGPDNCTPAARDDLPPGKGWMPQCAENPELRKAISVLRGWSAEAAGRTGLAESVLIVCNAAESTLPLQMYRIRGRNFEMVRAGPISISEVPND